MQDIVKFYFCADHSWLSEISVNNKNEALVNQNIFMMNKINSQPMQDYITDLENFMKF